MDKRTQDEANQRYNSIQANQKHTFEQTKLPPLFQFDRMTECSICGREKESIYHE